MSSINRVRALSQQLFHLFSLESMREFQEAKEIYKQYQEGAELQGRRYNSLAWLQGHPAISQIPELAALFATAGASENRPGVKILQLGGKAVSTALSTVGTVFAAKWDGKVKTFDATVLKKLDLAHSREDQKKTSLAQQADHIPSFLSGLLRALV